MYVNLRILVLKCETVIIRAVPSFFALVPPPPLRSLVCYSYSYSFDNSFLLLQLVAKSATGVLWLSRVLGRGEWFGDDEEGVGERNDHSSGNLFW